MGTVFWVSPLPQGCLFEKPHEQEGQCWCSCLPDHQIFLVMHEPSLVLFNLQYLVIIQVPDDSIFSLTIPKFPIGKMHVVGKLKGLTLSSIRLCGRDSLSRICKTVVSYDSSISAKLLKLNT